MTRADRWLLPDGIEEVLPPQARRIEHLRRHLLDLLDGWGYDLVMPPALEYLDSLLTGTAKDLDLRTFKVTDQLSGRMMGLSADTTPQVARIDAHSLAPEGVSRLCYCRTVFHAKAGSLLASRTPTQIGAELYGETGSGADTEIISLMVAMLDAAGVQQVHLDIGHVGVFRALAAQADLSADQQSELFDLLKLKCASDIDAWAAREVRDPVLAAAFARLIRLQGTPAQLESALQELAQQVPSTAAALADIRRVAGNLAQRCPQTPIYFDLSELRGYHYHTGLVFAAYIPGYGDAIAQGGRYDETGAVFGRARPATGFSADLKVLARSGTFATASRHTIVVPDEQDPSLWAAVAQLRAEGHRVVVALNQDAVVADQRLVKLDGQWQLAEA